MTNLPIAEGHEDLGQRTKTVYLITSEVDEVGVLKLDPGTPHKEEMCRKILCLLKQIWDENHFGHCEKGENPFGDGPLYIKKV